MGPNLGNAYLQRLARQKRQFRSHLDRNLNCKSPGQDFRVELLNINANLSEKTWPDSTAVAHRSETEIWITDAVDVVVEVSFISCFGLGPLIGVCTHIYLSR